MLVSKEYILLLECTMVKKVDVGIYSFASVCTRNISMVTITEESKCFIIYKQNCLKFFKIIFLLDII